jgi:hypothetical protein
MGSSPITGMEKSLKNVDFVGSFEENLQKRSKNVANHSKT